MKIPGMFVLILHCLAYNIVGSSRASGASNFLNSTVGSNQYWLKWWLTFQRSTVYA